MLSLLLACNLSSSPQRPPPAPVAAGHRRQAQNHSVDCKGGADFSNLRDAVAKAQSGDQISVAPCTYYGTLDFEGKSLKILSTAGAAQTTLLASPGQPVVVAKHGEGTQTQLSGFTLSGGGGTLLPAVENEFSSLTLSDCIITGNTGLNIVYGRSPHLTLERVQITGNTATEGVVIRSRRGSIILKDTTVACDSATVGYSLEHGAALIDGGEFLCEGVRAIEIFHGPGRVQRTRVHGLLYVENEGSGEATIAEDALLLGGASVYYSDLQLRNVVVAGVTANAATVSVTAAIITGAQCGLSRRNSQVSVSYTDFWANEADVCDGNSPVGSSNNIAVNPLFVGEADYHLSPGSPCINTGPSTTDYNDTDGSRNDMGAYGGPLSMDGGW